MPHGHDEHVPEDSPVTPKESQGKVGPIIGIIIIILVLLIGVLYFWGQRVETVPENIQSAEIQEQDNSPEQIEDDFSDIEQELDDEFASMEAELESDF